jgi:hypothetical protein
MSILDLVQQQLGPQGTQQIADQIGADPSTTQSAIQAALPMILGGMATTAREPGGAGAIQGFLGQSGGGGLGGMLGGLLGGGGAGGGLGGGALGGGLGGMLGGMLGGGAPAGGGGLGGILGSVLGRQESAVQDGVQQASGLNGDQTKRLLMILAPIAIAAIAQQRSQRAQQPPAVAGAGAGGAADLDGDGIPDYLEQEARQAQARSQPHVGGLVGRILDMAQRPGR